MSLFRSRESSIGFTNFDSCQNRTIEYTDFVYNAIGITETDDLSKEKLQYAGSSAELHCSRTSDSRVTVEVPYESYQKRDSALTKLKREAGAQVCRTCVYAPMTPLEVAQYDANVAKVELEKIELQKARAEAIAELAAVDPAYKHML